MGSRHKNAGGFALLNVHKQGCFVDEEGMKKGEI